MCVNFIQENILSEIYKDRALKATGRLSSFSMQMHFITLEIQFTILDLVA